MNKKILFTGLFVFIFSVSCLNVYAEEAPVQPQPASTLQPPQAASAQQPAQTPTTQEPAKPEAVVKPAQPSAESYIIIKNKSPQEMFDDANYLYQLGEYENALVLFNKVQTQSQDPELKRKAELAREVIDILLKSERVDVKKAPKEIKHAEKLKKRQKQVQLEYLYKEAASSFHAGDYPKAAKLYNDILAIAPDDKEARGYVQDKIPQALKEQKVRLLYREALENYFVGDYDKARPAFQEIVVLNPLEELAKNYLEVEIPGRLKEQKIAGLLRDAKVAFYNNKEYEKAAGLYKEALALDPAQAEAKDYLEVRIPREVNRQKISKLYEEIKVKFDNKEYDQAAQLCKQLLAIEPKEVKANDYLKYLIPQKLKEQKISALYDQAKASFDSKDYPAALKSYKDILALDPNQKVAKRFVYEEIPAQMKAQQVLGMVEEAKALFEKKDYEKASQLSKDVLSLEPGQKEAKELLKEKIPAVFGAQKIASLYKDAAQCLSLQDYDGASRAYKEILAIDPNQAEAKEYLQAKLPKIQKEQKLGVLYSQAMGYFNSADYDRSRQAFSQILNSYPEETEAKEYLEKRIPAALNEKKLSPLYTQAFNAFNSRNYPKATQLFQQILSIDPSQLQAKEYLEKRIPKELNAQKIPSLYKEARASFNKKDYPTATRLFQEILALDPKQEEARMYVEQQIPAATAAAQAPKKESQQELLARSVEQERLAQQQKILAQQRESEVPPAQPKAVQPEAPAPVEPVIKEAAALPKSTDKYPKDGALGYLYEMAFRYYDEGELTTAKEYFMKILVVSPREETAQRYLLALLKYQRTAR